MARNLWPFWSFAIWDSYPAKAVRRNIWFLKTPSIEWDHGPIVGFKHVLSRLADRCYAPQMAYSWEQCIEFFAQSATMENLVVSHFWHTFHGNSYIQKLGQSDLEPTTAIFKDEYNPHHSRPTKLLVTRFVRHGSRATGFLPCRPVFATPRPIAAESCCDGLDSHPQGPVRWTKGQGMISSAPDQLWHKLDLKTIFGYFCYSIALVRK